MIEKIFAFVACLALTRADVFSSYNTYNSQAPSITSYSTYNNAPITTRRYQAPAPIYEDTMEGINVNYGHGTQQTRLFNVLNTPYPTAKTFDEVGAQTFSQGTHNQVLFNPAYRVSNSVPAPVTYTTHTHSTPLVNGYSGPLVATRYGQPAFASHTPVVPSQALKTTITYSEAPVVSHTTFTGHGTSYIW